MNPVGALNILSRRTPSCIHPHQVDQVLAVNGFECVRQFGVEIFFQFRDKRMSIQCPISIILLQAEWRMGGHEFAHQFALAQLEQTLAGRWLTSKIGHVVDGHLVETLLGKASPIARVHFGSSTRNDQWSIELIDETVSNHDIAFRLEWTQRVNVVGAWWRNDHFGCGSLVQYHNVGTAARIRGHCSTATLPYFHLKVHVQHWRFVGQEMVNFFHVFIILVAYFGIIGWRESVSISCFTCRRKWKRALQFVIVIP